MGKLAKAHSKPIIEFGIGAASQNVDNKHEVKEMGLSAKKKCTPGPNNTTSKLLYGLLPTYLIIFLPWISIKGWFRPLKILTI